MWFKMATKHMTASTSQSHGLVCFPNMAEVGVLFSVLFSFQFAIHKLMFQSVSCSLCHKDVLYMQGNKRDLILSIFINLGLHFDFLLSLHIGKQYSVLCNKIYTFLSKNLKWYSRYKRHSVIKNKIKILIFLNEKLNYMGSLHWLRNVANEGLIPVAVVAGRT